MRGKAYLPSNRRRQAEQDPRRERARARDQADRSDNTASRACRFEVSAEQSARGGLFLEFVGDGWQHLEANASAK